MCVRACSQVFVRLFLVVGPWSAAAEQKHRSEYRGFDLSQLLLPRLQGPKSIIGQKQRHIMYCMEAETEDYCVCVWGYLVFCQSRRLKAEPLLQLATVT